MKTFTVTLTWYKNKRTTYRDIEAEDCLTACQYAKERLVTNKGLSSQDKERLVTNKGLSSQDIRLSFQDIQVSSVWYN